MIAAFYRDGVFVTEDIDPLEYIKLLKRANEIHIDDMYEAIGLLQRGSLITGDGNPTLWVQDVQVFLAKMSGPSRG